MHTYGSSYCAQASYRRRNRFAWPHTISICGSRKHDCKCVQLQLAEIHLQHHSIGGQSSSRFDLVYQCKQTSPGWSLQKADHRALQMVRDYLGTGPIADLRQSNRQQPMLGEQRCIASTASIASIAMLS